MASCTSDTPLFKVLSVIILIVIAGILIANIIYYNKIRNSKCETISKNQATAMLWIQGILLFFVLIYLVWVIIRASTSQQTRSNVYNYLTRPGDVGISAYRAAMADAAAGRRGAAGPMRR